jgi:hypothetical protein
MHVLGEGARTMAAPPGVFKKSRARMEAAAALPLRGRGGTAVASSDKECCKPLSNCSTGWRGRLASEGDTGCIGGWTQGFS